MAHICRRIREEYTPYRRHRFFERIFSSPPPENIRTFLPGDDAPLARFIMPRIIRATLTLHCRRDPLPFNGGTFRLNDPFGISLNRFSMGSKLGVGRIECDFLIFFGDRFSRFTPGECYCRV